MRFGIRTLSLTTRGTVLNLKGTPRKQLRGTVPNLRGTLKSG